MTIYAIIITIIAATLFVGWWHERKAKLEAVDALKDVTRYIRQRETISLGKLGIDGGGKGGDARVRGTGIAIGGAGGTGGTGVNS